MNRPRKRKRRLEQIEAGVVKKTCLGGRDEDTTSVPELCKYADEAREARIAELGKRFLSSEVSLYYRRMAFLEASRLLAMRPKSPTPSDLIRKRRGSRS